MWVSNNTNSKRMHQKGRKIKYRYKYKCYELVLFTYGGHHVAVKSRTTNFSFDSSIALSNASMSFSICTILSVYFVFKKEEFFILFVGNFNNLWKSYWLVLLVVASVWYASCIFLLFMMMEFIWFRQKRHKRFCGTHHGCRTR